LTLGSGTRLRLTGAEVTLVELDLRRPVGTAIGSHYRRPVVMVQLSVEGPGGRTVGWGECAALGDTTFDAEDAAGAFTTLTQDLVPRLTSSGSSAAALVPGPSSLAGRIRPVGMPLAFAALEMAVADVHLRASGRSLAEVLGVTGGGGDGRGDGHPDPTAAPDRKTEPARTTAPHRTAVLVGAVVGTTESVEALMARVDAQVDAGFARVKLKIGPGWDLVPAAAVRRRHPDLFLQVDANGSYSRPDIGHLLELDSLDLACIEQPFPHDDLESHAVLAQAMHTPVCLDESLHSPDSVRSAIAAGACEVVCVKPARLGGLTAALEVYRDCTDAGVPLWVGGMFESGFARSVNTALAAMPGFVLPGDLAPAASYLTEDLVSAPAVDRHDPDGRLRVAVHTAPGLGPTPDHAVLARRMVASWNWSAG
jgi:O-succinylbenzoate synthase